MYRIKHFDLATVALYSFIMIFIASLVFMLPVGLIFSVISELAQDSMPSYGDQLFPIADLGWLFFLFIVIGNSIGGTIVYTIAALLYNLLSLKLGGIKISVEKLDDTPQINQHVEGLEENQ